MTKVTLNPCKRYIFSNLSHITKVSQINYFYGEFKTMTDPKTLIENLRQELHAHNYRYYVLDEPSISDYDFDMKLRELIALEREHPEYLDPNSAPHFVELDFRSPVAQDRQVLLCFSHRSL